MQDDFKKRAKKTGAIIAAAVIILYLCPLIALVVNAAVQLTLTGEKLSEILLMVLYATLGGAVIIGILMALRQRLGEIQKGEEEDAELY